MRSPSPQREFAIEIVRRLRDAGHTALFAGGCVRDALLGREAKDYDVATTALPEQVRQLFGHRRTLAVGASFGVIMVIGPADVGTVEVATFRTEGPYQDGRRPEHVTFATPQEDAHRRDFSINGMFFDPVDERVLDYVGGESDLAAKIVRAIGDPHERIREDKLRMLRAIRFTATLGFSLDTATASAIREMSADLTVVSAERITQEMKRMLVDVHRRRAIELADDVGLIQVIFPELRQFRGQETWKHTLQSLALLDQPSFELALTAFLLPLSSTSTVLSICRRMKLSNGESARIGWLTQHHGALDEAPELSLSSLKRILAHPGAAELLNLETAVRIAKGLSDDPIAFCRRFLEETPSEIIDPPPLITGDDLIKMGLFPGPRFKSVLVRIRDAQLNLEIHTPEEASTMAIALWNEEGA
ncbi:CCA tRNA nucleotidyltransferase [Schlesneria sp.]|uniref:CCA tRNA nucleotidyltransferase n=1 Tax=Schlesneria sp. TaxID=2762018 RepID=UPI002F1A874B